MTTEQWIKKMGEHNTDKYETVHKHQAFFKACWDRIEALLEKHKDENHSNS